MPTHAARGRVPWPRQARPPSLRDAMCVACRATTPSRSRTGIFRWEGGASRAGKQPACVATQRVPNAGDLAPVVICAAGCALRRVASASALPPLRPRASLRRRLGPLPATSLCRPPTNLRRRLDSGVCGGAALLWLCAPRVRCERAPWLWLWRCVVLVVCVVLSRGTAWRRAVTCVVAHAMPCHCALARECRCACVPRK